MGFKESTSDDADGKNVMHFLLTRINLQNRHRRIYVSITYYRETFISSGDCTIEIVQYKIVYTMNEC